MKLLAEVTDETARGAPEPREIIEASPRASRRELESVVAQSATAILLIDAEGAVQVASRPAMTLLGCVPGQLHGEPAAMFLPLLTGTPVTAVGYSRKTVVVRADGALLRQNISAIIMDISDFSGWLILLRDAESFASVSRSRWH